LKGAISPEELLQPMKEQDSRPCFIDIDPKIGFGVRNFHIQACKMATVSDIVVYGDEVTPRSEVEHLAALLAKAQKTWSRRSDVSSSDEPRFNTFVLVDSFELVLKQYPHLVAIDGKAILNPSVMDFCRQERHEMCALSSTSEITNNVWLGPSPDPNTVECLPTAMKDCKFDILIETIDFAPLPDNQTLGTVEKFLSSKRGKAVTGQMQFPSSGSLVLDSESKNEIAIDGLLQMCRWIHRLANAGADHSATPTSARRFFIHCPDGYTETTLLALAYLMFSERLPLSDCLIRLHRDRSRNFFAYPSDKDILERFQVRLAAVLPAYTHSLAAQPAWMQRMDGSLPSRILPYLYLGNLAHTSNPGLLRSLNIKRILSVGEPIAWPRALDTPAAAAAAGAVGESRADWHEENFLYIEKVQDNGLDPLTEEIERCLAFVEEGRKKGEATLVHCRVGVSRSATICIAEVMRSKEVGFARA